MGKKKILFVDDEPNILSGIGRMLRSLRDSFELQFAENGRQALDLMETEEIDVVVSDMRMPGMDGAHLLTEIQQRHPHAVRIMLSGQADDASVIRTVGVVHQFLAKPCDPDKLKEVLIRASALHDLMTNGHLKDVVSGIGSLPSLPSVYQELQRILKDPETTADDVARVIERDMAMTAKLLQLVNSAFFGLYQKVENPARAIKLLGLDTVKILVLGVQIFSEFRSSSSALLLDYLWEHSIKVAQCSRKIALEATDDLDLVNNCYIAGMLHDIGRLLFISRLAGEYEPVLEAARAGGVSLKEEEERVFHATHADVGAYLIGLWGFNGDIVEAIAFHNDLDRYPGDTFSAALAVHVADACYYAHYPETVIGAAPRINERYLGAVGYADQAQSWIEICETVFESQNQ